MSNQVLKQVKLICKTENIWPEREKGQNFMVNQNVIDKIIDVADLKKTETVLEVGPGLGILTESLVASVKRVISVELDDKLYNFLKIQFLENKVLDLLHEDILRFDPQKHGLENLGYKIVANLPYNITSIFLKKFITHPIRPSDVTLLLQKEVAQRICAKPGALSLLAISVQLYGEPKIIDIVPKKDFWPSPKVDSAILQISSLKSSQEVDKFLEGISEKDFWRFVRVGFSAKRKQLQNNLSSGLKIPAEEVKKMLKKANFDPKIRAQNLSIEDWVRLSHILLAYLNKQA